jgi:hypothetical protein
MKLFDVQTCGEFLGISRQSVDRLISDKKLEAICIRSGRRKRILRVTDVSLKKFLGLKMSDPLVIEPALIHKPQRRERDENHRTDEKFSSVTEFTC